MTSASDSTTSMNEKARQATPSPQHEEMPDEEPKEIELADIKARAMRASRNFAKHNKDKGGFVKCTKAFIDFTKTEMCDNLVVAVIFYVSSSLFLSESDDLDMVQADEQRRTLEQSKQIISSLYCQVLLSPMSADFRVREERIFYETLIFFLDACACFAVRFEPPDKIYALVAGVFRRDIPDPCVRRQNEFLPITEIVRRNWLSQRVPGKNRTEIAHATLQGTTDLIGAMVDRRVGERTAQAEPWDARGFPVDCIVPYAEKVLNREALFALPQPKAPESSVPSVMPSHAATREASPR